MCVFLTIWLAGAVMAQPTARQWNAQVTAGWNLGNQLECPPPGWNNESTSFGCPGNHMQAETSWGSPSITQQTLQAVKDAGFNAVRIPVRWQCHITNAETMTVNADWMQRVKEVAGYALNLGMKVIINTHHDKWLESRPTNYYKEYNNQKLALLWTNIANAFKDYDYNLAFAGTNEVHVPNNWNAPTNENLSVQNSYNQTFINAVRATGGNNLRRHLIVQTYVCNPDFGLYNGDFIIPTDIEVNGNNYMSVEFHYYTPWDYAGECKYNYWGKPYKDKGEASPSDEKTMTGFFEKAVNTWGDKGLGLVMGEWGVTDRQITGKTDLIHENMTYYCRFLVSEAIKRGISTFVWDNNSFGSGPEHFGIFDRHNNMTIVANWTVTGIQEGIGVTGIEEVTANSTKQPAKVRKILRNGRLLIQKGEKNYTLQGYEN